jgi:hypothetical protein
MREKKNHPKPRRKNKVTASDTRKRTTDGASTYHNDTPLHPSDDVPPEDASLRSCRDRFDAWLAGYREMTSTCQNHVPFPGRGTDLSVSYILSLATKPYVASVMANI